MSRPQRIPVGRSWRDLPPSPPSTFVPAPTVPDAPVVVERARVKVWPFVAGGLAVVALGFIVGLLLPRADDSQDSSVETPGTTLPEVIVPPAPTSIPSDRVPLTIPDLESAPVVDELFTVPRPPEGFRVASNITQSSSERVDQSVVVTDEVIEVEVSASASAAEPTLPIGESVTVRGQEGVITRGDEGRFVISWIEPGKISFEIDAPAEFGLDAALSLAESLEVR